MYVLLLLFAAAAACTLTLDPIYNCTFRNITVLVAPPPLLSVWKADYSTNPFTLIASNTFTNIQVQVFVFTYTGLNIIEARAFRDLSATTQVYISRSTLTTIAVGAFMNMPRFVDLLFVGNTPNLLPCFPWLGIFTTGRQPLMVTIKDVLSSTLRADLFELPRCTPNMSTISEHPSIATATTTCTTSTTSTTTALSTSLPSVLTECAAVDTMHSPSFGNYLLLIMSVVWLARQCYHIRAAGASKQVGSARSMTWPSQDEHNMAEVQIRKLRIEPLEYSVAGTDPTKNSNGEYTIIDALPGNPMYDLATIETTVQ